MDFMPAKPSFAGHWGLDKVPLTPLRACVELQPLQRLLPYEAITIKKANENNSIGIPDRDDWHRALETLGFIPVIPPVSCFYTF